MCRKGERGRMVGGGVVSSIYMCKDSTGGGKKKR